MAVLKQLLTGIVMCCALQTQARLSKGKDSAESLYSQAVQETKQEHYDKGDHHEVEAAKARVVQRPRFYVPQPLPIGFHAATLARFLVASIAANPLAHAPVAQLDRARAF